MTKYSSRYTFFFGVQMIWIEFGAFQNNCAQVRKTVHLRGLMETYCSRAGVKTSYFRFLFQGDRIVGPDDTPRSVSGTTEIVLFPVLSHNADFLYFPPAGYGR